MLLLIWGCDQYCPAAADWHDGQITHDTHARFAGPGESNRHAGGVHHDPEAEID
jgi:hypothetical protein